MRCAIFCNVIDNFGDIGVCWRLARQLAHEYSLTVILFVNDLASFAVLASGLQPQLAVQQLGQITVQYWPADLTCEQPVDVVIEGFGCRLSDALILQMAQQSPRPVWINLEYLSAEDWVQAYHGMTSVHPSTGLQQLFWFPSVTAHSGGLIREQGLIDQRNQFQQDCQQQDAFWQHIGVQHTSQFDRRVSLFSYPNPAIADFLDTLAADRQTTLLLVPYSQSIGTIEHWLRQVLAVMPSLQVGQQIEYKNLCIAVLPFLSHRHYDQLLWACDLNFVRGEDSCVRAQWAGRPWLWHIYPQEEQVHLVKLAAWITQVEAIGGVVDSWHSAMQVWNSPDINTAADRTIWQLALNELPQWSLQAQHWSNFLVSQPDLATRLMGWITRQSM